MLQDHLRNGPREVYILYDVIADLRMGFDQLEFRRRQPAWPIKNFARHVCFANIVDCRPEPNPLDALRLQPEFARDGRGQFGDPRLMPGRIGVALLQSQSDRADGADQGFFQLHRASQMLALEMVALQTRAQRAHAIGQIAGQFLE